MLCRINVVAGLIEVRPCALRGPDPCFPTPAPVACQPMNDDGIHIKMYIYICIYTHIVYTSLSLYIYIYTRNNSYTYTHTNTRMYDTISYHVIITLQVH